MKLRAFIIFIFTFGFLFFGFRNNALAQVPPRTTPAASDPDVNIRLRGWNGAAFSPGLVDHPQNTDTRQPQLSYTFGAPNFTGFNQVKDQSGQALDPSNVSTPGMATINYPSGQDIRAPVTGYQIGGGFNYVVLYATSTDIVIHNTLDDSVARGYTVHFLNINVNPDILAKYNQNEASGRKQLLAIPCGISLGTSNGNPLVSIRDTGSFMDIRFKDWWGSQSAGTCQDVPPGFVDASASQSTSTQTYNVQDVPCTGGNTTTIPEFHSLRPYPASPCYKQIKQTALFCGNDLVVKKTYNVTPGSPGAACGPIAADGSQTCTYTYSGETAGVSINLASAKFPILGNTEDVPNATWTSPDTSANNLSAEQRVNNYVSWYLNGVIDRAEEDFSSFDQKFLVNFSGPIKKLLPWTGQFIDRLVSVNNAQQTADGSNAPNGGGLTASNEDNVRHNQLVGCPVPVQTGSVSQLNVPCYLMQIQYLAKFILSINASFPTNELPTIRDAIDVNNRLMSWTSRKPPLESDFPTFNDYWKAYLGWLGNVCINTPFNISGVQYYVCAQLPGNFNMWASLFGHIPFSTTEDRIGQLFTDDTIPDPKDGSKKTFEHTTQVMAPNGSGGDQVDNVSFTPISASTDTIARHKLFFSHTQEVAELSKQLQNTFATKSDANINWEQQISNDIALHSAQDEGGQASPGNSNHCENADAITNSGDNLYGDLQTGSQKEDQINGTIKYDTKFTCKFQDGSTCLATCLGQGGSRDGCYGQCYKCNKDIVVSMGIYTKTPNLQEDFDRLVGCSSGSADCLNNNHNTMGIFERFYPKVGIGSPVESLKDIPGVTTVSYSAPGNTALAGNPSANRDGSAAQIFFPHLGSIEQYFLQGIQKALRPKISCVPSGLPSSSNTTAPASISQITGGWVITTSADADNLIATIPSEISRSGQKTCDWANGKNLSFAVNANFFRNGTFQPYGPVGYSGQFSNNPVQVISRYFYIDNNGPHISDTAPNMSGVKFAVTGVPFNSFLPPHNGPEPRTVLGLTGNTLYVMVLQAATPPEAEAAIHAAGANDALMLDGDTSTSLCQGNTPIFGNNNPVSVSLGIKGSNPLNSVSSLPGGAECTEPSSITQTQPAPPAGSCKINCNQSIPDSSIPPQYLGALKNHVADLASRWVGNTGTNYAKECYNDVISQSITQGIDPVFSLAIWLHESGASNYTSNVTSCITQDFGINGGGVPPADFTAQLGKFLTLPTAYQTNYPQCFTSNYTPMQNFFHIYRSGATINEVGICGPTSGDLNYDTDIKEIWGWITNGYLNNCPFPGYPNTGTCG